MISRCAVCGSKFHWASKCPDSYENSDKSYFSEINEDDTENLSDNEEVYLSLFIGYTNSKCRDADKSKLSKLVQEYSNAALLDSGCSKTVCGEKWLENYKESLSDYDKHCIKEKESTASFTFGDSSSEKSSKRLTLPCYIAGKRCSVETDVVKCNIPLLLSKRSMKKANMCLDFGNDTALFANSTVPLRCSTSGHYLLLLSM